MLNKVQLLGRLGADPEVRYMPSGVQVTTIRLATSSRRKDKQTGKYIEETEWHRVVFFTRLAEIAGEYLKKGSQVFIEGMIRTQTWEKDGEKRYSTEIVAGEMHMLDNKPSDATQSNKTKQDSRQASSTVHDDDFMDSIPF